MEYVRFFAILGSFALVLGICYAPLIPLFLPEKNPATPCPGEPVAVR
jgi:hypothetical protein